MNKLSIIICHRLSLECLKDVVIDNYRELMTLRCTIIWLERNTRMTGYWNYLASVN